MFTKVAVMYKTQIVEEAGEEQGEAVAGRCSSLPHESEFTNSSAFKRSREGLLCSNALAVACDHVKI